MGAADLRGEPEPERDAPWRELFGDRTAQEILPLLVKDDRLEIWPRCAERLLTRCYLVDMERLYYRSVARIAYAGQTYAGTPPFTEFLRDRIDHSMDELMREDREEERMGVPVVPGDESRYTFISQVLGMEIGVTRAGICQFNVLDERMRRAFFELVVQMKRFNRYVAEGNGPPERAYEYLRIAFEAIGVPYDRWLGQGEEGHG